MSILYGWIGYDSDLSKNTLIVTLYTDYFSIISIASHQSSRRLLKCSMFVLPSKITPYIIWKTLYTREGDLFGLRPSYIITECPAPSASMRRSVKLSRFT